MRSKLWTRVPMKASFALAALVATLPSAPTAQSLIRTYPRVYDTTVFSNFDVVGRIDGVGWNELIAGDPFVIENGLSEAGSVNVIDGRTGERLYSFKGTQNGYNLGYFVKAPGDMSGDGIPDLAATGYVG